MSVLESFILGIVQGATEFLPVSSSGHLVIGQELLSLRLPGVAFEVALHVATLASVVLVYRKRLWGLVAGGLRGQQEAWRYIAFLFMATLPAAAVGLGAEEAIGGLFEVPWVAGAALLLTGSFLWSARGAMGRDPKAPPTLRVVLLMGFAQAFAIIPGISRSGATVVTGLWLGVEPEEAAEFSFLMAIPAILGAAVLQLSDFRTGGSDMDPAPLLLGAVAAGVTGFLAIRTFVAMLRNRSFHRFAPYCWAVGGLFLLYLALGA